MIEQSLINTNFMGRDGFKWWIGIIPPLESQKDQVEANGSWGNRYKVRIQGYHPFDKSELPDEDLPWANVMLPTTAGSGGANVAATVRLQQGDVVMGFFLDGDNAQIPVIFGTLGKTDLVIPENNNRAFAPLTGYNENYNPPNDRVTENESNEQSSRTQPTNRDITVEQAQNVSARVGQDIKATFDAIGDTVPLATTATNSKSSKVKSVINNLLKEVRRIRGEVDKVRGLIRTAVQKVVTVMNEYVGIFISGLIDTLENLLKEGLEKLFQFVYAKVLAATGNPIAAELAGVAAQEAMVGPVQALEKAFSCISGQAIDFVEDIVTEATTSLVDSVENLVVCVEEQYLANILNGLGGIIDNLFVGPLELVEKLLRFFTDFSVKGFIDGIIGELADFGVSFACNQTLDNYAGVVQEWVVGVGPSAAILNPYEAIKENVDLLAADIDPSTVVECVTEFPENAIAPQIRIFGGIGTRAQAIPIFGNIVQVGEFFRGSVIGARVIDGGEGYQFPPFVEITDGQGQGFGAVARTNISPEGSVTSIQIISEGENYSIGDVSNLSIIDVIVEEGGSGFVNDGTTIITDQFDNEFTFTVNEGSITSVTPNNNVIQIANLNNNINASTNNDSLPVLRVISETGTGAVLRPILGVANINPPINGEVQNIVDCVS